MRRIVEMPSGAEIVIAAENADDAILAESILNREISEIIERESRRGVPNPLIGRICTLLGEPATVCGSEDPRFLRIRMNAHPHPSVEYSVSSVKRILAKGGEF